MEKRSEYLPGFEPKPGENHRKYDQILASVDLQAERFVEGQTESGIDYLDAVNVRMTRRAVANDEI